jgi:tellurite resistance protein TerC
LIVIVVILAVTVVASLLRSRKDPGARAHAGSLRDTRKQAEGSKLKGSAATRR